MIRTLKFAGRAVVCLILVLALGLAYRSYVQRQIARDRAIRSPVGIDSLESVRIGGIDQWIHVRGDDANNPVLLFIHGGPGVAFIAMAGMVQRPWEKHFTVVQWDQRGAGKTYASNDRELQRRTMTISRMEQDALDLVNYLRTRFKRDRIVVLGHSWGTILGLWLAHEHPDIIEAYVGVAQVVDVKENDKTAYEDALEVARARNRVEAVRDLENIRPFPPSVVDLRKGSIAQGWEAELLGPPAGRPRFLDVRRILLTLVSAPEYSLGDVLAFVRGQRLSVETLAPQIKDVNLAALGTDFRVPVLFFHGQHDPYSRPILIQKYVGTIAASTREVVWFENAGHFPFFEDQQKFTDELVNRVLPLAH